LNLPFENVGINDARTDCGLLEANIDCNGNDGGCIGVGRTRGVGWVCSIGASKR
jgi:hypothetical protein